MAKKKKYRAIKIPVRNAEWAQTASWIISAVADAMAVTRDDMLSRGRRKELAEARQVAAWIMRRSGISYPQIAVHLARGDHTTIIYAARKIDGNKDLRRIANKIIDGQSVSSECIDRYYKHDMARLARAAPKPRLRSRGDCAADLVIAGTHDQVAAAHALGITRQRVHQAVQARRRT